MFFRTSYFHSIFISSLLCFICQLIFICPFTLYLLFFSFSCFIFLVLFSVFFPFPFFVWTKKNKIKKQERKLKNFKGINKKGKKKTQKICRVICYNSFPPVLCLVSFFYFVWSTSITFLVLSCYFYSSCHFLISFFLALFWVFSFSFFLFFFFNFHSCFVSLQKASNTMILNCGLAKVLQGAKSENNQQSSACNVLTKHASEHIRCCNIPGSGRK